MKKVLALMLAMVLVLSLAACGGGNGSGDTSAEASANDVNLNEFIIGKWERSYTASKDDYYRNAEGKPSDYSAGDEIISVYEFFEGGVYHIENTNKTRSDTFGGNTGKWVIEDGFLKLTETALTESANELNYVYKIDSENKTITKTDSTDVVYQKK